MHRKVHINYTTYDKRLAELIKEGRLVPCHSECGNYYQIADCFYTQHRQAFLKILTVLTYPGNELAIYEALLRLKEYYYDEFYHKIISEKTIIRYIQPNKDYEYVSPSLTYTLRLLKQCGVIDFELSSNNTYLFRYIE